MSFPSRLQIAILVAAATLIVCSLGVRSELKMSQASIGIDGAGNFRLFGGYVPSSALNDLWKYQPPVP